MKEPRTRRGQSEFQVGSTRVERVRMEMLSRASSLVYGRWRRAADLSRSTINQPDMETGMGRLGQSWVALSFIVASPAGAQVTIDVSKITCEQ
jgi:hypothetical protein